MKLILALVVIAAVSITSGLVIKLTDGSAAVACTRYAATTGSDSNGGSSSAPYRSVSKLVSTLQPGETGCLEGGVFTENVTMTAGGSSESSRVTLTTAPGYALATIRGYVYTTPRAGYVSFDRLVFDGSPFTSGIGLQIFGDFNTVSNSDISNGHMAQSCVIVGEYEGSFAHAVTGTVLDGNRIHECGKTSDGKHDHGIYLASSRNARVTNNVIYGNAGGWGIQLWADAHGTLVANNVVDGNAAGNIIVAGASYSSLGPSSNNTIRDNILTWPQSGRNAEPYWSGSPGKNNVLVGNCVFGATVNFVELGNGWTESGSIVADPLYRNRSAHDYALQPGSPCAGKGPSGSSSAPAAGATTPATTAATTTTAPATTTVRTTTTAPATTTTIPTRTTTTPPATTGTTVPATVPTRTTTTETTPATTYRHRRHHHYTTTTDAEPTSATAIAAPAATDATTKAPDATTEVTDAITEPTDAERLAEARATIRQHILSWRQQGRSWWWIKRQDAAIEYYEHLGGR